MARGKEKNEPYRHHRRSKSASESSFGLFKNEAWHCIREGCDHSKTMQEKSHGNRALFNQDLINKRVGISPNICASLEKDIKQLELYFNQERSTHNVLNRTIGQAASTFSPGHKHFSAQTRELMAEIELLEGEIASREQHVLSLYKNILNQNTSKFPPSTKTFHHRASRSAPSLKTFNHFASRSAPPSEIFNHSSKSASPSDIFGPFASRSVPPSKTLNHRASKSVPPSEIVVNSSKSVTSSEIFNHSASRSARPSEIFYQSAPPSEISNYSASRSVPSSEISNYSASRSAPSSEISSSLASPKIRPRKHPSVISAAFCSSKKFPFQYLQMRALKKEKLESGGFGIKPKSGFDGGWLWRDRDDRFGSTKASVGRKKHLDLSLKEHLQHSPNEVSEEMVRCMVSIYCSLNHADSSQKNKKEKICSPFLSRSRSSTTVVFPRRSNRSDENLFCNRKTVEFSSVWAEKYQLSDASSDIKSYRLLVEQLERVDPSDMEWGAKCAFWLNIYNSLVMHAYLAYGTPNSSVRRLLLFQKAAYNIGGHIVTAGFIEQLILHLRTPRVGRWIETLFLTAIRTKSGEEKELIKSNYVLEKCEPLVLFALCTGASSDPMLRVYTPKNILEELEEAKKEFLQANVIIKKTRRVLMPKIVERYAKEASFSCEEILKWVSKSLGEDKFTLHDFMHNYLDSKSKKNASQIIEWLPYITRFRYVFAKNLTKKLCSP